MKKEKIKERKKFLPENIKEYESGEYDNLMLDFEYEDDKFDPKNKYSMSISGVIL